VASLVSIFILNYTILSSLVGLFESSKDFISVKSHIELIEKFINELPESAGSAKLQAIPNPDRLDIIYRDVTYQPEGSQVKILDKFNLRIYPRQKIAIIGHAGSGKTSLVTLLTKIKGFQGGDIFINGISISKLNTDDLREKIVFIPQHPKLFNRTLADNLTYGLPPDITIEKIFAFMRENGFTDLEAIFRKRMGEKVGKSGSNFSGGQKALIWMIRAIMKPSSLVILDEPTSALDKDSRTHVARMIDIISRNRSLIIITHNYEMNDKMDRIITIEKGKIISDVTNKKKLA
jgi:ABC-type bacteriocin/lantibiotic exporter with double-glycine peptidase domain